MKKIIAIMSAVSFIQLLTIVGLATSFKVVMIILIALIAIVFLGVPSIAFYYLF
jgi:hypothetical protein